MLTVWLRKFDMALRALGFSRANPDPEGVQAPTVATLEEKLDRAEALAVQQESGVLAVKTATNRRTGLLHALRTGPVRLLARIAEIASVEVPDLADLVRMPARGLPQAEFLTAVRAMVAAATPRLDIFLRYGMPATLLDEITALLDQYDTATADGHAGRRGHTGARAELTEVTAEIMELVDHLDALNEYRFRHDAERLAAWRSARNIVWPARQGEKKDPPSAGGKETPAA